MKARHLLICVGCLSADWLMMWAFYWLLFWTSHMRLPLPSLVALGVLLNLDFLVYFHKWGWFSGK